MKPKVGDRIEVHRRLAYWAGGYEGDLWDPAVVSAVRDGWVFCYVLNGDPRDGRSAAEEQEGTAWRYAGKC